MPLLEQLTVGSVHDDQTELKVSSVSAQPAQLDDDTAVACRRPSPLPLPRADPTTPGSVTLPMIGTC